MRNIQITALIFLFVFSANVIFAEDNSKQTIPEGMEAIPIGGGGSTLIVPKGAKTRQVGAQIIVEGTKEYMARMVEELNQRLTQMEENQKSLRDEVKALRKTVEELQIKSKP